MRGDLVFGRDFVCILPCISSSKDQDEKMLETYVLLLRVLKWEGLNWFDAGYSWGDEIIEIVRRQDRAHLEQTKSDLRSFFDFYCWNYQSEMLNKGFPLFICLFNQAKCHPRRILTVHACAIINGAKTVANSGWKVSTILKSINFLGLFMT